MTQLIDCELPLRSINIAAALEKKPTACPSHRGFHPWWSRLPVSSALAAIYAGVVDACAPEDGENAEDQQRREKRLQVLERLLDAPPKERQQALEAAREEIRAAVGDVAPVVVDPFCGGGSIPYAAQLLGLEARGCDRNAVAVLISKALVEIAPGCAGVPPIWPSSGVPGCNALSGLAADIRHYARRILEEVQQRHGQLYPMAIDAEGASKPVSCWLWARTVPSPSPRYSGVQVPLLPTYWLTRGKDGRGSWLEPSVDHAMRRVSFAVHSGEPADVETISAGTSVGRKQSFRCLLSGDSITREYVREQAGIGKMKAQLLVTVLADSRRRRTFASPDQLRDDASRIPVENADREWLPRQEFQNPRLVPPCRYGMTRVGDMFTDRQIVVLTSLADAIADIRSEILKDAIAVWGRSHPGRCDPTTYADAVTTFLGLALGRTVDFNTTLCKWSPPDGKLMHLFGSSSIPMAWTFAEANLLGDRVGSWITCADHVSTSVEAVAVDSSARGNVVLGDACTYEPIDGPVLICTDPPYPNNTSYAMLSNVFYPWLRRALKEVHPDLFEADSISPEGELNSIHRDRLTKDALEEVGNWNCMAFVDVFRRLRPAVSHQYPLILFYGCGSQPHARRRELLAKIRSGWLPIVTGLVAAELEVDKVFPIVATQSNRRAAKGARAMATYLVLVCRPRDELAAAAITLDELLAEVGRTISGVVADEGGDGASDVLQLGIGRAVARLTHYPVVTAEDGSKMDVAATLAAVATLAIDEVLSAKE